MLHDIKLFEVLTKDYCVSFKRLDLLNISIFSLSPGRWSSSPPPPEVSGVTSLYSACKDKIHVD